MIRNPYDRRGDRTMDVGASMFHGIGGPRESPVAFHDIEALVHSAYRRGAAAAQADNDTALQHARRVAWEEGHAAGYDAGSQAVIDRAEERHGAQVRAAVKASREMLEAFSADERKVPKRDLVDRVERHAKLFEALEDSHHARFEELPF